VLGGGHCDGYMVINKSYMISAMGTAKQTACKCQTVKQNEVKLSIACTTVL
jgi:hypothetical protein